VNGLSNAKVAVVGVLCEEEEEDKDDEEEGEEEA